MSISVGFGGLDIAASGIQAFNEALQVIENDVTNANTTDFSRQTAILGENIPFPQPGQAAHFPGQIGTGVQVVQVQQSRLPSLDSVFQLQNSIVGNSTGSTQLLQQIQSAFGEPGPTGISTLMNNFFSSLRTLAQNPQDLNQREIVLSAANQFTNGVQSLNNALINVVANANNQVSSLATQINQIDSQIAGLNTQIREVTGSGMQANDLKDQRLALMDQLSNITGATISLESNGSSVVTVGGQILVNDNNVTNVSTYTDVNGRTEIQLPSNPGVPLPSTSGQLAGVLNARDQVLGFPTSGNGLWQQLNTMVGQFVTNINSRQQDAYGLNGSTNIPFFKNDPDNDADVDSGIGTDGDGDAGTVNNMTVSVNIVNPADIAASVASVTSVQGINLPSQTVDPTQSLASQSAAFQTAPSALGGQITINGVNIAWLSTDSLNSVLSKINSSGAGVVASYDATSQKVILTRDTSVNQTYVGPGIASPAITVTDAAGNLSQALLINTTANPAPFATAVSTTGTPGDNTNANLMARLQTDLLGPLANQSVTGYYGQTVAQLGSQTGLGLSNVQSQTTILQQIDKQRSSISGVNLDEEAANLVKFQQAVAAATKLFSVINSTLGDVIGMVT